MGFENLMAKAEEIRQRAIAVTKQEYQEAYDDLPPDVIRRIEEAFENVPRLFEPFTRTPDPEAFDGMIEELKNGTLSNLSMGERTVDPISTNGRIYPANTELAKIVSASDDVYGWTGRAAQEFKSNYLDPFPAVVGNQFTLAAALKAALEAEQAVWRKTREDIWRLADNTAKRLEHLNDCTPTEWTMVFTVVAAICFVVAVPLAAPATVGFVAAATTVAAVGSASSVAALAAPDEPPTYDLKGATAYQVIESMGEAVRLQIEYVVQTEERIAAALRAIIDLVWSAQSNPDSGKHLFCLMRPWLAESNANLIRSDMGYTD